MPATANLALPYPAGGDLVMNGNDVIQALAEAIDALIGGPWTAYVPAWTSTGTQPTLGGGAGAGVLSGRYKKIDKTVHFWARLQCGSATTYGTGSYRLSLPVAPAASWPGGPVLIKYTIGGNTYHGLSYAVAGSALSLGVDTGAAGGVIQPATATVPAAFGLGSEILVTGTYEAA